MNFRKILPLDSGWSFGRTILMFTCVLSIVAFLFVYNIVLNAVDYHESLEASGENAVSTLELSEDGEYLYSSLAVCDGVRKDELSDATVMLLSVNNDAGNACDGNYDSVSAFFGDEVYSDSDEAEYITVVETEAIPFETVEEPIVYSAYTKNFKDTAGKDGLKQVTTIRKVVDGKVVSSAVVDEYVISEPKNAKVYVDCRNLLNLGSGAPKEYDYSLRIKFTAYTYVEVGGMITATGDDTKVGFVAVDKNVIPLHSLLYIVLDNGFVYGYCYAKDVGGGIKGNRIDIFLPSLDDTNNFGIKMGTCYVVNAGK